MGVDSAVAFSLRVGVHVHSVCLFFSPLFFLTSNTPRQKKGSKKLRGHIKCTFVPTDTRIYNRMLLKLGRDFAKGAWLILM